MIIILIKNLVFSIKKYSLELDSNQWPKDFCWYSYYSPPLYQLSYRGMNTDLGCLIYYNHFTLIFLLYYCYIHLNANHNSRHTICNPQHDVAFYDHRVEWAILIFKSNYNVLSTLHDYLNRSNKIKIICSKSTTICSKRLVTRNQFCLW